MEREQKTNVSQIRVLLDDVKLALNAIDRWNFEVEFGNVMRAFAV